MTFRKCDVDDCPNPARHRRWCNAHYARWWRYGDPLGVPTKLSLEDKYRVRVDVRGDDECWPWLGHITNRGYGRMSHDGKKPQAHNVGWNLYYGEIPGVLVIDHICHNDSGCLGGPSCPHRSCQNPQHWELVTPAENTSRGQSGINSRSKTHCPRGHEYTKENTYITKSGGRMCIQCGNDRARTPEMKAYRLEYQRQHRDVERRKMREAM